ncbi:MAG: PDZ domain-containing protein, partial [Chitinophagales bacterium]|nr:PDZ domain-containing protein [Chitinophagales bacterium]
MSFYSNNLKRISVALVTFLIVLTAILYAFARFKSPPQDKKQLLTMIMDGINQVHYSPQTVDDAFSNKIFNEFIKRVDNNKKFLLQSDIAELSKYKNSLDDEINIGSTDFFIAVISIYNNRFLQAYRFSKAHLDTPFNYEKDESIETDEDKSTFAKDTIEMEDGWRKYMKLQVLQQLYEATEKQNKAKEKSDTVKIKSFTELEADARAKVKKNNEDFFKRVRELDETDWYAVYLNCIANIEDPHTEYFPPVDKQNFDIRMSGQLEGIGAQLQQRDGDIKIMSIVAGSASWRQGQLKAGDVIIKVGQGAQEPVSVEGMRLDKAIQLIRGKKGTEVRITVRKPDGSNLAVPIIRDVVVLEATYAQSVTINNNGKKIGYIRLPEFYTPIGKQGGRGSSDDVKKELLKLEAENVEGII